MRRRTLYLACAAAATALLAPAAATAAPTAATIRIEGINSTIYDGPVTTDGKVVTPESGDNHRCDGTNAGAYPTPGPTPTTALDDASDRPNSGFNWDGTYTESTGGFTVQDYFVTKIGGDVNGGPPDYPSWGVFLNSEATSAGGCQVRVHAGDEVLWAYDAFSKNGVAQFSGPDSAQTGQQVDVKLFDNATKAPLTDGMLGPFPADANGVAHPRYDTPGIYRLKVEAPKKVRSRFYKLCVDPPGAPACTSGDKAGPGVRIDVPAISSSLSRFGTIRASWQGDDGGGSGVNRYRVDYRRADGKGSGWKVLKRDTVSTSGKFRGGQGGAYQVRVQAFDRANNPSVYKQRLSLVPLDELSQRVQLSKGWSQLKRQGAYERTVSRSTSRGSTAGLRFAGSRIALISRKLAKGGRVRVSVDGRSKVVSLRGKSGFRKLVFRSRKLGAGTHRLKLTTLSSLPAELDAIAIRP